MLISFIFQPVLQTIVARIALVLFNPVEVPVCRENQRTRGERLNIGHGCKSRCYFRMKFKNAIVEVVERIDRLEWDFSTVPAGEECGCCYFEWARESSYIKKELDHPAPDFFGSPANMESKQRKSLENSHIVHALPGRSFSDRYFDKPWLRKPPAWRADFCQRLKKCWNGLNFARSLDKRRFGGFHVGMSPYFNRKLWTGDEMRCFDPKSGFETLMVTINWNDLYDSEVIEEFTKWIRGEEARPKNIGQRDAKGKNKDQTWQVYLERLAIMRLRHHYTFAEIAYLLPARWADKEKFQSPSEAGRERRSALQTFFELYPFLPKQTKPLSWREV